MRRSRRHRKVPPSRPRVPRPRFGGSRWRRGTKIGDEVGDGHVDLVTDGGDHWDRTRGNRASHGLVIERPRSSRPPPPRPMITTSAPPHRPTRSSAAQSSSGAPSPCTFAAQITMCTPGDRRRITAITSRTAAPSGLVTTATHRGRYGSRRFPFRCKQAIVLETHTRLFHRFAPQPVTNGIERSDGKMQLTTRGNRLSAARMQQPASLRPATLGCAEFREPTRHSELVPRHRAA